MLAPRSGGWAAQFHDGTVFLLGYMALAKFPEQPRTSAKEKCSDNMQIV